MNIIFAVQSNEGWESVISSRFGRTPGYICFNETSDDISYHSNEVNVQAGHGAGIQAAQIVVNLKADVVITGGTIGPKAFQVLKEAGISVISQVGEIGLKESLGDFVCGKYSALVESDQ